MFLDDEVAAARTRRNEARWGFYLALAALAACIVMILGLMLLAIALLAGTTFALWRQQIAAFVVARVHRHG
ncbi:hypothetical protein [Sinorhizobium chiapasense]|uniref:Transmembrane protein n=1 Tax=Sinorhizobium chiapasense TaxID=501572 RepID=A0ABZ2B4P2_9HYPH